MTKTEENNRKAFEGEAKAHVRIQAFAQQAEKDGYVQIAKLFRAVAEAERVHAMRHLKNLKLVKSTEENLKYSFESETTVNELVYPQMIKDAIEDGDKVSTITFTHARDVEETHAALYKKALDHLMNEVETAYHVCKVCGYISDGEPPDACPVCGAKKEMFYEVK
ncbi:MAG: rubrerythrin family protein [bacterium]